MRLIVNPILYFLGFIASLSCEWNPEKYAKAKHVVCTTTIVGDMVDQLLGDEYKIKTLMGAGVDPHIYEPKPSDVRALGEAQVIIINGLHLEGKMSDLFKRLQTEKSIVTLSDGMPRQDLIALNQHSFDPHVWFDMALWMKGVKHCKLQLQKQFPEDKQKIEDNFKLVLNRYISAEKHLLKYLDKIPKHKRILITSHDAFHYFGKAYGIKVKALQGVSTVTEPGLRNVSNLVDYIVKNKIPAVFIESSVSPKAIEAVIEACSSQGHTLKIGGLLYSDALGAKGSGADTYFNMVLKNSKTFSYSMQ